MLYGCGSELLSKTPASEFNTWTKKCRIQQCRLEYCIQQHFFCICICGVFSISIVVFYISNGMTHITAYPALKFNKNTFRIKTYSHQSGKK